MSGPSRSIPRVLPNSQRSGSLRQSWRCTSSTASAASTSTSTSVPPLRAALLLSRPPLLTPTPTPLESAYYAYNSRIRSALSNPVPTSFYFKAGSLPLRRFQRAQHELEVDAFGPRLAGKAPDVGDLPLESQPEVMERDHWAKADTERGERSLERRPEDELFCLVKEKGKWGFPRTEVQRGEGLDDAIKRGLTGVEGEMGGQGMDTWVVAKKPVGVLRDGEARTFFLRGHILSGEPVPAQTAQWKEWAWLSPSEIQNRLSGQGQAAMWSEMRGMFGIGPDETVTQTQGS